MRVYLIALTLLSILFVQAGAKADVTPPDNTTVGHPIVVSHTASLVEITDVYGRIINDAQILLLSADIQSGLTQIKASQYANVTTGSDNVTTYQFSDAQNASEFTVQGDSLASSRAVFPATQFEIEQVNDSQTLIHIHFGEANRQIVASILLVKVAN